MLKTEAKKGQAVIELIPSFFIFAVVLSASISLFEAMRNATITQEVARNMAFAKIANSGTLTTPPEGMSSSLSLGGDNNRSIASPNPYVTRSNTCFSVYPTEGNYRITLLPIYGVAGNLELGFTTKLSVYRSSGTACR